MPKMQSQLRRTEPRQRKQKSLTFTKKLSVAPPTSKKGVFMRKLSSRNFGLKNRDMTLALKNALKEQGYAYKTIDDYTKHASSFVAFIESNLVTTLNEITREHVEKYGLYVQNKFHLGDISLGTAHMKICAVNTLLRCARMDEKLSVYTVKDMKILTDVTQLTFWQY